MEENTQFELEELFKQLDIMNEIKRKKLQERIGKSYMR